VVKSNEHTTTQQGWMILTIYCSSWTKPLVWPQVFVGTEETSSIGACKVLPLLMGAISTSIHVLILRL